MKTQGQILRSEMSALIENSCAKEPSNNSESYSFQKALLKFFFGAADVTIDYKENRITLITSATLNAAEKVLYKPNNTILVDISYLNLETTLKECLEAGEKQNRFYKSLLFHFNHVRDELDVWSA